MVSLHPKTGAEKETIMRKLLLAGLAGLMLAAPVLAHDRGGRHADRHYDHGDYRWQGTRYRGAAYVHPYGYGYRPWTIGYRLPSAYYNNRYWIGDPGYYRLPPAYRGTRWVRVGPDALLITVRDGAVVQAVRGLYW